MPGRRGRSPGSAGDPHDTGDHDREQPSPEAAARQICYRLLALAPRTRAQLADALRRRGVADDVADAALDQLADARLIDDPAFAKAWVESRHYGRGLSRRSLSAELRQRGVDGDDIDKAMETLDPEQEVETARRLVERRIAATRGQPADARIRRVAGMLARKGYPPGLTFRLIREALEAERASETGDTVALDDGCVLDDADAFDDAGWTP
ncbi:MAG TPA: regulatory protein RecX [Streptosporangiaceae bacterium]|nr:regulatory protein RecX [Streptosporangiaceae bacterium]